MNKSELSRLLNEPKLSKSKISHLDISKLPIGLSSRQCVYHLLHDITEIPVCNSQTCNNVVKWDKNTHCYRKYCSVKCATNSSEFKAKKTHTIQEKYGVSNPSQCDVVKQKKKETLLKKYGVDHYSKTSQFKAKYTETSMKNYGVSHVLHSPEIRDKIKQTNLKKYNAETPVESNEIKSKIRQTLSSKYNVDNPKHVHLSADTLNILNDQDLFTTFCTNKTVKQISTELGVDSTTVHDRLHRYNKWGLIDKSNSNLEVEMTEWLTQLNVAFINNTKTVISPLELDFYLPDFDIAIEMNGVYWHCDKIRPDKKYHYNKWKMCRDQGIHLVTIFGDMWYNHQNKVKELILSLLKKKYNVIGARLLSIQPTSGSVATQFLNQYHLQNSTQGTHFGAYYNDQLVSLMTFGKSRASGLELKRFVTDNNASYPGVASKLFKTAQYTLEFTHVVSFSDNQWFNGNLYKKLNFKLVDTLNPGYKYYYQGRLQHCSNFTKGQIKKKFPEIDITQMTEFQAMDMLNIPRVWDCGKKKWMWTKSSS